jgi:serine/threonine protein kinase
VIFGSGQIEVVSCNLDGMVYARKIMNKHFALRNRDVRMPFQVSYRFTHPPDPQQCFAQLERDILLQARKTNSDWAPHLLCAFQTPTELNLVMDFVEGGTLWDVLESSPLDGKISEADLLWWTPQIICAIDWCHEQGYVHRSVHLNAVGSLPSL